ncbi:MAG: class I SAM-dependent methyltransferase [Polymorphobacter sp.]
MTPAASFAGTAPHAVAPRLDSDEAALLDFAVAWKARLRGSLRAALQVMYETVAAPAFASRTGRRPQHWREVEAAMVPERLYRWWSALLRAQQEYYVDVTAAVVERQRPELNAACARIAADPQHGSLVLVPGLEVPAYQALVDIHCVPGSYFLERSPDDVAPGARSDLGSIVFAMGRHGGLNEDKGLAGARFVKKRFPDLQVNRILDLGCTIGMSTLPWCDAFPDAQVHALDLSAPCLRYGHARAEVLGRAVHFRQGNAEATDYPDASFDLIVSHILLHETSAYALPRILAEAHRMLRPGGVMLHIEVPVRRTECFDQFLTNWDARNNNEPFWSTLAEMDLIGAAVAAGFAADAVFEAVVPTCFAKTGDWLGFGARKAA